jgi:hypothetical protein
MIMKEEDGEEEGEWVSDGEELMLVDYTKI